jgi:hypothetical protein
MASRRCSQPGIENRALELRIRLESFEPPTKLKLTAAEADLAATIPLKL